MILVRRLLGSLLVAARSGLGRNLFYLYLAQGANYLFPLLTIPYLSRTLGLEGFGLLSVGQALAVYLQLLVDYGFPLSGTREVARHREDRKALAQILAGVLGAKLVLVLLAGGLTLLAWWVIPVLRPNPLVAFAAFFYASATAFGPSWFYRGLEEMRMVAFLEVGARFLALMGIIVLVREPSQVPLVIFINGAASLVVSLVGTWRLWRMVGPLVFSLQGACRFLSLGSRLFPFQAVMALYLVINPIALSLFASPREVGLFSGAERIVRALWGLLDPLNRAFFPRISHTMAIDERRARSLAARALIFMGIIATGLGLTLVVFAPWLLRYFLGASYEEATPLLRVMALALPLGAVSNALGIQWALALGLDVLVNRVFLLAGFLQLGIAFLFAAAYGPGGVAWGMVLVALFEVVAFALVLARKGGLPLG
ncbi:oligosaccharide flippase family protein [Thermus antranikianii]|uniref:oligosaccharide flippase family protein n=1 Tax=Thermus antranikianii TaxID=88190 RepID=UPI001C76DE06|nr:oligosaccharide flippase family protein [Thermus antranikianii]QWK22939.1 MAG: oligosaccharide flippase family protein [Thermus antranikianii]